MRSRWILRSEQTVNGDGFGFGWYPADPKEGNVPGLFRSTEPAWNDQNLRELTQAIESPLFFSHVRAAAGPPIQQTNCHPFRFQNWLFMHNGAIAGFGSVKRDLVFAVDPSLYPHIQGTTDSEVLFYLALTLGLREDPIAAMTNAIQMVESAGHEHGVTSRCRAPSQSPMAAPCGLSGTPRSTRRAPCSTPPTSHAAADVPAAGLRVFGQHAHVVVSEPLNDLPGVFIEVPESTVAVLGESGYHHQPFLADEA